MSGYQRNSVMAEGQTDRKTEDRQSLHGTLHLWGSNKKYIKNSSGTIFVLCGASK